MEKYVVGQTYKAVLNDKMHTFEVLAAFIDAEHVIRWNDGFEEYAYKTDMDRWTEAAEEVGRRNEDEKR